MAAAILMALGLAFQPSAAAADPPKEVLQYIRDAKREGVPETKIKQQLVKAGWSADVVDAGLAFEENGGGAKPADSAATPLMQPTAPSLEPSPAEKPSPTANPKPVVPDDYLIGSGDTLQISVWKEPEVSVPSVVVRPDGKITVPLVKDVDVGGLTPRQAEKIITDGLAKFYTAPNVTVVIAAINSKKIYIIGAVRKEGTLPYTYGMTVLQALSEAGGLTDYARRKKIYLLRTAGGREYRLDFNYDEVVRGERTEQNYILQPGDTVVVPH